MIEATGLLTREGGGFVLKCDGGRRLTLELSRVPVDLVEKRVTIVGVALGEGQIAVDGVRLA